MKENEIREIRNVARNVRAWCVSAFKGTASFKETLRGYCAICSFSIFEKLLEKGIDAEFVENKNRTHAFVLVGDLVVDVTAKQFGKYPQVMIRDIGSMGKTWKVGKRAKTIKEVKKIMEDWPVWQQPKICLTDLPANR